MKKSNLNKIERKTGKKKQIRKIKKGKNKIK